MGRFKLTLPWGTTTIIGQVVATLEAGGASRIVIVTGHRADEVRATLDTSIVHFVFNPDYATGEMVSSIRVGLCALCPTTAQATDTPCQPPAALLCLGDQPQMEAGTVRAILATGAADGWQKIIIPSYRARAGHPILLPAWLWPEILACTGTLRDVMTAHRAQTRYLVVDTPGILADLDTPDDYEAGTPKLTP